MRFRAHTRRARRGFTAIEMMMAMIILALATAIGYPKLKSMKGKGALQASKRQVAAYLTSARAAAIRRGATSTVMISGNRIWVTVDSSGTNVMLNGTLDMYDQFKVSVVSNRPNIQYDLRGMPKSLPATGIIWVSSGSLRDSVCVSRTGLIMQRGCTP